MLLTENGCESYMFEWKLKPDYYIRPDGNERETLAQSVFNAGQPREAKIWRQAKVCIGLLGLSFQLRLNN